MSKTINILLISISLIIASLILGYSILNRNKTKGLIHVTGLGQTNFESDLIVWEANFNTSASTLKTAYTQINSVKSIITGYLKQNKIPDNEIIYSAVSTNRITKAIYNQEGHYSGEDFLGYELEQTLKLESKSVAAIERLSREITELLNQGIQLYSKAPRYYYTKLADLKIELISKATEDARIRAEQIAKHSNTTLGQLKKGKMGIFQITGQNSNENHDWGGTFNTSDKMKTASITMKLDYFIGS